MKKRSLEIEKQENFLTGLWSNDQNLSSNHFLCLFPRKCFFVTNTTTILLEKDFIKDLLLWHFWKHWIKNCPNSDLKHISELKQGTPLPFGSLNYANLLPDYFKDVKQFIVQYFTTDWSFCILNDSSGKYWWTLNNISL